MPVWFRAPVLMTNGALAAAFDQVDEIDPPLALVEIHQFSPYRLSVGLEDVGDRGIRFDEKRSPPGGVEEVEQGHRHQRLADSALAAADEKDCVRHGSVLSVSSCLCP